MWSLLVIGYFLMQNPAAMEWFRKGEELIGTPQEYSQEQVDFFEKAAELDPKLAAARYNLALIYIRQKNLDRALFHLEKLNQLSPQDPHGYLLRAGVLIERGQFEPALQHLQHVIEIDPENVDAWEYLGNVYRQQERLDEALEAFDRMLKLRPSSTTGHFELGMTYYAMGRYQEALAHLEQHLAVKPDDFQAHYVAGVLSVQAGNRDSALEHFLQAEHRNPSDPDLNEALGNLLLDLNRPLEASQRLMAARPSPLNLANLGVAFYKAGRLAEAEKYFEQALEKESSNPVYWRFLGEVRFQAGRDPQAIEAFEKGLVLSPQNFELLYGLGSAHANLNQLDAAARYFEEAVRVSASPQAHLYLGIVRDRQKLYQQAQVHYQKALDLGLEDAQAHFRLAAFFSLRSQRVQALRHLQRALEMDSAKYVSLLLQDLKNVHSEFDNIRYTEEFEKLLNRFR
ncbi:MAG: tetratricopeptide repeat protein [Acidobacteria bacterium]|nr:tetratricopeptide repeat protein [Acidobacteriota bacterium]